MHILGAVCVSLRTKREAEASSGWAMNHLCITPNVRQFSHVRGKTEFDTAKQMNEEKERSTSLPENVISISSREHSTQYTPGGKIHKSCEFIVFDQWLASSNFNYLFFNGVIFNVYMASYSYNQYIYYFIFPRTVRYKVLFIISKLNFALFGGFSRQFWVLSRDKWDNQENKLDNNIIKTNPKQLTSNCG